MAIDDVGGEVSATSGDTSTGSQPFDIRYERSVASFDVPHVLAISFLYDLKSPIKEGFAKHIFEGFTFGGIYRIQSGAVQNPFVGGINLNNAFNHPYFTPGTGDVTDSTFNDATFNGGGITAGNVSGGRIIQFQLRYQF